MDEKVRRFSPKLSICKYHLPDDPENLKKIILEANPNYVIREEYMKLYAYVPKSWKEKIGRMYENAVVVGNDFYETKGGKDYLVMEKNMGLRCIFCVWMSGFIPTMIGVYYFSSAKLYKKIYHEYYHNSDNVEKKEKYIAPMYN